MSKMLQPPDVNDRNASKQARQTYSLATRRLSPPPNFFDAAAESERAISTQTEAALILLSAESKRKAVDYLKAFSVTKTGADDYNELLKVSTDYQLAVSEAIMLELQQITGSFQTFRDSVMKAGEDNDEVRSGMATPLAAMVKGLGRIGYRVTRERFHKVFNHAAKTQFVKQNDDALKRELRSWVRVFVSYP